MCRKCFEQVFLKFPSYWEFEAFEIELRHKVELQLLLVVQRVADDSSVLGELDKISEPEKLYQCQTCQEIWALSSPDNAWRGYFLPSTLVGNYIKTSQRKRLYNRAVRFAILVFIAWIVWRAI